ncbi:hypothetical protein DFH11DRAFT_1540452 [Phellopilus nigrolimitatus]|nr:hypothetical protein DFH11DRAFT_1540452 [Phellopilus nigrolimitatus]
MSFTPTKNRGKLKESLTQLSTTIGHGLTNFATNLLHARPFARARAAQDTPARARACSEDCSAGLARHEHRADDKLAKATTYYAGVWDRDGPHALSAALAGDAHQLDRGRAQGAAGGLHVAARTRHGEAGFETVGPAWHEQSRLEVEDAEDDLVQKTEVALMLMKTVFENARTSSVQSIHGPLKNLNELVKAQLA